MQKGSTIKSDGSGAYKKAGQKGYVLERSVFQKNPQATAEHLKWVNMLTSNLKRFLLSTYHGVFPKYRDAYLEIPVEVLPRFNFPQISVIAHAGRHRNRDGPSSPGRSKARF